MSVPLREAKGAFMDYKTVGADLRQLQQNPNAQREGAGEAASNPKPDKAAAKSPFGGAKKV